MLHKYYLSTKVASIAHETDFAVKQIPHLVVGSICPVCPRLDPTLLPSVHLPLQCTFGDHRHCCILKLSRGDSAACKYTLGRCRRRLLFGITKTRSPLGSGREMMLANLRCSRVWSPSLDTELFLSSNQTSAKMDFKYNTSYLRIKVFRVKY